MTKFSPVNRGFFLGLVVKVSSKDEIDDKDNGIAFGNSFAT